METPPIPCVYIEMKMKLEMEMEMEMEMQFVEMEMAMKLVYPPNTLRALRSSFNMCPCIPDRIGIWQCSSTVSECSFNTTYRGIQFFHEFCPISTVESLFGDIVNYFKFIYFKKNSKIGLSSFGKMYIVCALLRNALTCLYGNTTSDSFGCDPPTLQQYFA